MPPRRKPLRASLRRRRLRRPPETVRHHRRRHHHDPKQIPRRVRSRRLRARSPRPPREATRTLDRQRTANRRCGVIVRYPLCSRLQQPICEHGTDRENRIDRGDLGKVTHIEANYVRRRGIPGRGSWFTRRQIAGGGALIDLGVHAVDLAMYLLDYPDTKEVNGVTRSEFGSREEYAYLEMWADDSGPEDSTSMTRRARSFGVRATRPLASRSPGRRIGRRTTSSSFVARTPQPRSIYSRNAQFPLGEFDRAGSPRRYGRRDPPERYAHRRTAGVFDEIVEGRSDDDSIAQALAVQEIIDAVYRSSGPAERSRSRSDRRSKCSDTDGCGVLHPGPVAIGMRIERSLVLEGVPREVPVDTPITVCVRDRANRPVEGRSSTSEPDGFGRTLADGVRSRFAPRFLEDRRGKAPTDRVVYEPATALVRAVPRTNHRRTRVERSRKPPECNL